MTMITRQQNALDGPVKLEMAVAACHKMLHYAAWHAANWATVRCWAFHAELAQLPESLFLSENESV